MKTRNHSNPNPRTRMSTTATATRPASSATTITAGTGAIPPQVPQNAGPPPAEPRPNYPRLPMPAVTNTNIEAWFITMDFWFTACGINDDHQRFATVLAAMDPNVVAQLIEVVREAPLNGKFEFIKSKLVAHFADSEQRKLNRLLSEMPLGDKRPSELFHEMKRVAGTVLGDTALKSLWAQRLPEAARPVIAASSGTAAEFTKIADSIVDALAPRAIHQTTASPPNEIGELRAIIAELRNQIGNMPRHSRSRSRNNNDNIRRSLTPAAPTNNSRANPGNSANGNPTNNNSNANADSELCWYHQTYGSNARKCREPCRRYNRPRTPNAVAAADASQSA